MPCRQSVVTTHQDDLKVSCLSKCIRCDLRRLIYISAYACFVFWTSNKSAPFFSFSVPVFAFNTQNMLTFCTELRCFFFFFKFWRIRNERQEYSQSDLQTVSWFSSMIHDWTVGYIETIMKKLSLCNCQYQSALGRTKRKNTHESFSHSHHRDLHLRPTSQNASQNLLFSFSLTTNIRIVAQLKHTHSAVLNSLFN